MNQRTARVVRERRPGMRRLAAVVACACLVACRARTVPEPAAAPARLAAATQLVVVTTPDWSSTTGTLRRFERASSADDWHAVGTSTAIVTGRTGLAWGVGFDAIGSADAPHKREGDGKSPAGAFPLDTVFGFAPRDSMRAVKMPYVTLTAASDCVDDEASAHYNRVVSRDAVSAVDWSSAEHMRTIGVYRIGVIVGYNTTPARGRGSCIFLHIWSGPASTTAGCTAMDAEELRRLIEWLDAGRRPAIVQLPGRIYDQLRNPWRLPAR